ncbi:MAG: aldo/keto reductase [Deltaproteobacteria bacterium]|nr:aldo/keto reductase [Deltaproteobacteria bacterium]MBW2201476.1 aldo/keto reductase [Deltaproteobacteria bacterium]
MKQVTLGKTGLRITRLGFGGIPIQRVDERQAVEAVGHAVASGVDFIDTSRAYTTSEHRIGLALKQTDKRVVLASKSVSRTATGIRKDLETSLRELQKDYLDLYQCHFVKNDTEYEQIISSRGVLEELIKAKEEGLIGHIGITTHSLDLLDRVLDDGLFETIMVCFSFLEPAAREKIIPKAIEKDVGIIAMKPFSGGIIDNPGLALKYVLSQKGIAIIPGVEHPDIFDDNWEIFQGSYELDDKEKREIEEIRKRYEKTFCRRCDYCQPCSEDIPIQMILGIRSALKRFGKAFLEKDWIKDAIEKSRHCTECGECLARCPYELPIPDLIKENIRWLDEGGKST